MEFRSLIHSSTPLPPNPLYPPFPSEVPVLPDIQTILVPKGAEYQAVCRGVRGVLNPPTVFPVPVGSVPLSQYLQQLHQAGCLFEQQRILVMGLCGGLTPALTVGDAVLYQNCVMSHDLSMSALFCDLILTEEIQAMLGSCVKLVKAVTSDRVISRTAEKHQLAQQFSAEVVDMEGFAALATLTQIGVNVATLRVVSDDYQHDIPNLAHAFDENGSLRPMALAIAMMREPMAALHLISGSTKSLKILQNLTSKLFDS